MTLLMFLAGLLTLLTGADLLVRGASKLALALGISPLVVGIVVGSNTFNILGSLGIAGVVAGSQGLDVPAGGNSP